MSFTSRTGAHWRFGDNAWSCALASSMAAVPALASSFYLPALPGMAETLGITSSQAKLSFVAMMAGAILALLFCGPLSDRYGRRPVVLGGLLINGLACLALSQTSCLEMLWAMKSVQGIGMAATFTTILPMIRDVTDGDRSVKMIATTTAIYTGAMIVGPVCGAHIYDAYGWPMQFFLEAGYSFILLIIALTFLTETLTSQSKVQRSRWWQEYCCILSNPSSLSLLIVGALVNGAFTAYSTSAAFLYIHFYNLSPVIFGYIHGGKYLLMLLACLYTRRLVNRCPLTTIMNKAYIGMISASVLLFVSVLLAPNSLLSIILPMALLQIANGFYNTTNRIAVLELNLDRIGMANSLLILLHLVCDATASAVAALIPDTSLNVVFLVSGIMTFSLIVFLTGGLLRATGVQQR